MAAAATAAATAAVPRISIFAGNYMQNLIGHPVSRLQTSVHFDQDIPHREAPEQALGQAAKVFYDQAVYGRSFEQRLVGNALTTQLHALNVALARIPAQVRQQHRLGNFTTQEYDRVMRMRLDAVMRKHETAELNADPHMQSFWGSNRQLMFGKVVCDIIAANQPQQPALQHLLSAVFCSPTGGIIGSGTHNWWAEHFGKLRYSQRVLNFHSVCHDASGYCRNALDIGVGYTYIQSSTHIVWFLTGGPLWSLTLSPSVSPWAGQLDGCRYWKRLLKE